MSKNLYEKNFKELSVFLEINYYSNFTFIGNFSIVDKYDSTITDIRKDYQNLSSPLSEVLVTFEIVFVS